MGGRKAAARSEPAAGAQPGEPGDRSRAKRRGRRKRGGRGALARLGYWTLVLGVWAVIAAVGTFAFVASTLPPIQSLEVPKRPPTVEIVGLDGKPLVSRGEMSGTDV